MQSLSALLLSAALLLGAIAVQNADTDAAAKTGSFFIRVLQAAMHIEASTPTPALSQNIATVKSTANLYSSYSQTTRVLAQLKKGDELSIKRRAAFSSDEWVYVTAPEYNVSGWVLVSQLNMPDIVTDADLSSDEITEEYIPAYAKMGIVSTSQLNIRTAPGTGFDRIGSYSSGDRVGIIETNNGWGRTAKGWIYLGYVYMDGQVGQNPMVGNVTADLLNVRSGPGLDYTVCGSYRKGERLLILEQVYADGGYWGCTRLGWVSMHYIQADCIPGTLTPIYGYGTIKDSVLYVYPTAGTDQAPVGQIPQNSVVPILEVSKVGKVLWGRITAGWIAMTNVDMRAVFEQTIIPAPPILPVVPTEPPTEETTEATESTTEATTETTTEATEATTEATEATTEATEATTEATTETTTEATESTTEATTEATTQATTEATTETATESAS